MSNIKVGSASLNQVPLDWKRNKKNIIEAITQAKESGVQILCLPELAVTGYGCEDHFLSEEVQVKSIETVVELAEHTEDIFTCFGIPFRFGSSLYNVMVCVFNKKIIGIVPKQHLAGDGLHYEPRWFKPWPKDKVVKIRGISFGDIILCVSGICIGFEICEDAFVADRPGISLAMRGVDIILNPSASHFAFGKMVIRERLVVEGSRAFNSTYIYANLLGNEAGRVIYDGDCIIASCGELLARGESLNFNHINLTTAVVDLAKAKTKVIGTASFSTNVDCINSIIGYDGKFSGFEPSKEKLSKQITYIPKSKSTEFTEAITLGLFDYLVKSHSKGYVISLSGGADSAACAVLVKSMVVRAVSELGLEEVCNRFFIKANGINEIMGQLLTCVYQSTSNSSNTTLNAAKTVAEELGAKFSNISIDSIVNQYIDLAESIEGRKLSWETDDLALQNIQARARAPSIWMIANIEKKLLITTSNRSEAAVGYCTMDGDTAGSLAPIGGIDKAFILSWLSEMVELYPSLNLIIKQKPTAELRPGQSQTDEDDLMPYAILDTIETWAIVEKKGPQEVLDYICREIDVERNLAIKYVKKFFTMYARNQWKREKFSSSLYCDNHSLDPRTWNRFPILSGGFSEELENIK